MNDPADVEVMSNESLIDTILAMAHGRRKFKRHLSIAAWAEMQRRIAAGDAPDSVHELLQNILF